MINSLRHNVIKAGVRRLSISYSRISLKDICLKLHLDSEEDAEYIVAKVTFTVRIYNILLFYKLLGDF